jgi:hypothetical protein
MIARQQRPARYQLGGAGLNTQRKKYLEISKDLWRREAE